MGWITPLIALLLLSQCHQYNAAGGTLEPILEAGDVREKRLYPASMRHAHTHASFQGSTAFMAVVSSTWPAGLVPLFSMETEEGFELRRLPMRGQEYHAEPLFFALPPISETNASRLAGHWHGLASNSQRNHHSPDWQLAVDGERIAGRFDPMGEYRVAFITGGVFRSNLLRLEVEYINDRYILEGEWQDGKLAGTWRQTGSNEPERGEWSANRSSPTNAWPAEAESFPLFLWTRGRERCYSIASDLAANRWHRSAFPLCRVWKPSVNINSVVPMVSPNAPSGRTSTK